MVRSEESASKGYGHTDACVDRVSARTGCSGGIRVADGIELSAEQLDRLNALQPAAGERHDEANMASIDR